MKKLFLLILFLLNFTSPSLFCMQEDDQLKKITAPNGLLFVDQENNLKLIRESNLLENVIEIIESPTKNFIIAIVVEQDFELNRKSIIFLINYEKQATYTNAGPRLISPFTLNQLDTINGEYKSGNCKISEDGTRVHIKINNVAHSFINNFYY